MYAVEINNLTKRYGEKLAVNNLSLKVEEGSIYGFIGENGSGKSTTEKALCGLIIPTSGTMKILGKDYKDESVREQIGCLIEMPGCYPNISVWNNMMIQASNLGIRNKEEEVRKVLKTVRMEGSASNKFRNCSLGMKQRIGIAMALLGNPKVLVLDEPINGLDADGMRIMREVLTDITKNQGRTVIISSHILSELEKIATHYGIIRHGSLVREMTAEELEASCPTYLSLKTKDNDAACLLAKQKYQRVSQGEEEIRIYDDVKSDEIIAYLHENHVEIKEAVIKKITLEEYYNNLMDRKENA